MICQDKSDYIYVGHTVNFKRRKSQHKSNVTNVKGNLYNNNLYSTIRANGGFINWQMRPLEEFKCDGVLQARIREQYWIDYKQSNLNSARAFLSKEDNADKIKQYYKEYYENNRDRILEHIKEYQKEHYQLNRNQILEQQKEYREHNADKLKEKNVCNCGGCYTTDNKSKHFKTQKHQHFLNSIINTTA